jgi:hypothetical protein
MVTIKQPVAGITSLALNFDLIKLNSTEVHQDGGIDSELSAHAWRLAQLILLRERGWGRGEAGPIKGTSYKSSRIITLPRFCNEMALKALGVS